MEEDTQRSAGDGAEESESEEDDSLDLLAEAIALSMEGGQATVKQNFTSGGSGMADRNHQRAVGLQGNRNTTQAIDPSVLALELSKALDNPIPVVGKESQVVERRQADAHGGEAGGGWQPDPNFLSSLMDMGISLNAAMKALFMTGNSSLDAALSWVCEHADSPELNQPFEPPQMHAALGIQSCKMVFVVNTELSMSAGKAAAQCCHAAIGLYRRLRHAVGVVVTWLDSWERLGETKIALKGNSAVHLEDLSQQAERLQLPNYTVSDAGLTEIPAGSFTVLAVFGPVGQVNLVTGHLSLL